MSTIRAICRSYQSPLIRAYATIRFHILRQRFLDEIGQYLPKQGEILDVGCGFGLFSLYFAHCQERRMTGFDLDARRIERAQEAAKLLNLQNTTFRCGDARSLALDKPFDAAFMLDIVHHIPPGNVGPLLKELSAWIKPGGTLIVKDVSRRPAYKRWFTWWLDKAMDYKTPVHYWEVSDLQDELLRHFKTVHVHAMVDYLPYPHLLYICTR